MSWLISKVYRHADEALERIHSEQLPVPIVAYIETAVAELKRIDERVNPETSHLNPPMILVHGHGHLCHEGPGGGNYEVTTAKLVVTPLRFGVTMSLPLQVV